MEILSPASRVRACSVKRGNVAGRLDSWTIRLGDSDVPSQADRGTASAEAGQQIAEYAGLPHGTTAASRRMRPLGGRDDVRPTGADAGRNSFTVSHATQCRRLSSASRDVLRLAGLLVVEASAISADLLPCRRSAVRPHRRRRSRLGQKDHNIRSAGHISLASSTTDGRVEFGFEPIGQERVCPYVRFIRPERLRTDRWTPSSEIAWSVPLDPQRIVLPPAISQQSGSCDADLERMFAATLKVETIR